MIEAYKKHVAERAADGLPPLALDSSQVVELVELLKQTSHPDGQFLLELLTHRVPPGVDEAAYVKAGFLTSVAKGETPCGLIDATAAIKLLGTMLGGYNVQPLINFLDDPKLAESAADALANTLLVFDGYHDVMAKAGKNAQAKRVVDAWANANWFTARDPLPESITVTVFNVPGETNTDDLSPASEAWSRPDIPLHAKSMLQSKMPDALSIIEKLKEKGHPLVYVGDVIGTGSSRKSAINSMLWHMGDEIPYIPNKHNGGFVIGGKIAPIFFNTAEDSGALPIVCDVSRLESGDIVKIQPYQGKILNESNEVIAEFTLAPSTMIDEVRAGGRIPLIIGRSLTDKTREALGLDPTELFVRPVAPQDTGKGFTLAQKIVGQACGVAGIRPGTYCEPRMSTVGSQDTTGAMTRDELKELACLGFSADLVMQSFCHTAAYPKPVDIKLQHELPDFIQNRGGITLRPGDGIIHSWLNRMLLPDTVGTGGDSHTRFPIGISFPAGSGLVAFGAALGVMPLDMPESVLVRFKGEMQPGVTLRDLVNAIPYVAIQKGLLTVAKQGKKNIYSGRILEIEGLPDLKIEQAFELSDASAERSAGGCTVRLNKEPIIEYLNSNITLFKWMLALGYEDKRSIQRRIDAMQAWLDNPTLLVPDKDAEYVEIIEIDLNEITEPLLACPNDPDDIKSLSEVAGDKVDEVFIGSCMTNIGHYRAAGKVLENVTAVPTRLWIAPPTKMDANQLSEEGYYSIFGKAGARIEMPGCSLCMGNQARVADGATVVSTSTRNFPNRLGKDANVYLASAELAAVTSTLGYLPTVAEYMQAVQHLQPMAEDIYRYLNFNEMDDYQAIADTAVRVDIS
jgi:aconitate hydratase 2/2-methylisocitrate dehydratase